MSFITEYVRNQSHENTIDRFAWHDIELHRPVVDDLILRIVIHFTRNILNGITQRRAFQAIEYYCHLLLKFDKKMSLNA